MRVVGEIYDERKVRDSVNDPVILDWSDICVSHWSMCPTKDNTASDLVSNLEISCWFRHSMAQ